MDKKEDQVDDVVVVENHDTVSNSLKVSERELRRIIVSDEAKRRTKKLFEKAMFREKNNKILKGHEILDCDIIELNDSNDFSHQSKLLRTERVNLKSKTHTSSMPSTSSVSEDDTHSIGPSTSKKVKADISLNAQGKEGLSLAQFRNSKSQGMRTCCLCHEVFVDTVLKDHMLSCKKHTFEHTANDILKENIETNSCCHLCGKDMSFLSSAKRASHINACLDQKEDEKKQKEEHEKQLQQAQSIILNCPVCQKKFRSALSRTKHLKKCALSNKMSVEQIKNLAKQQQEEHRNQLDAGILPGEIKASLLKNTKGKPRAKKRICEEDEDIQLAIALSISLTEEKEKVQASSLHHASSSKTANLLLNLSKNQAEERISKRAASLIFSSSPPKESVSQTPAFKRKKQELDSPQRKKFWDKTSLASPLKSTSPLTLQLHEQEQCKQQPSDCAPYNISSVSRDNYYVPVLMPPVTVDNTCVGSKLKPVSAIPGRQRSMDGQGRQVEEEILTRGEVLNANNPGVDSTPQVEVQSQTVADLAELAAENEDADSQSSDDLFGPDLLSPDIEEGIEKDVPSEEAAHQLEGDSCELRKLSSSFLSLVNCPKHSDVLIATSHGELVPAHKIVLFARCPQLYKISEDGMIDFSSYSKESVLSVLKFIYGGEISLITDSVEDVIRICKSLCLSSLLEKAEKMWNGKNRSSLLTTEKAYDSCPDENQCPGSFTEEERDEPANKASSVVQDAQISNQSLGNLSENVTNSKFNEDNGDHVQSACQPNYSVEKDNGNTNEHYVRTKDANEMYEEVKDEQMDDIDDLSVGKLRGNATTEVADRQQLGISADDGHKQSNACNTFCSTNPNLSGASSDNPESPSITKSAVDAKSPRDERSVDNKDEACRIFSIELKNSEDREETLDIFAVSRKSLAETHHPPKILEVEITKAHTNNDVLPSFNEHSETFVDQVQKSEIQNTFQSISGKQTLSEEQVLDKDPIITQFDGPLLPPDSGIYQPLSSNQIPQHENEVQNPSSLSVQELNSTSTADIQGLNESLLQASSNVPFMINKGTTSKSKSKKVSTKEFKDLVSKAADGSLTDKDFEKITIKIEQDNCFLDNDVYIPSVLDDTNPPNPDELEITDAFIRPQRFKSKIRANTKTLLNKDGPSHQNQGLTKQQGHTCQNKVRKEPEISMTKRPVVSNPYLNDALIKPFQSLPTPETSFSKQNDNVSIREDRCSSESKLSTSYNSDIVLNSDDDLFDDVDGNKDKKFMSYGHRPSGDTTTSVMGSSAGCFTRASKAEHEREGLEKNKTNPHIMHERDRNIQLNSQVNEQDTHLITDSQAMQMELATAIVAEIQSVRNAEELSQSEEMDSNINMCPIGQKIERDKSRLTTDFPSSTNPAYAQSTPGPESRQINQLSLQEQLPDCITPIKKPSASDSPNLNSSVGSSGKKKTQRGLTRLKKPVQSSSSSNSPNIPVTNCESRTGNGEHADRNSASNRSDADGGEVTDVTEKQLEECRRNLDFDGRTASFSNKAEINEPHSRLPSSSFRPNQTLSSSSKLNLSAITKRSDGMGGNESSDPMDKTDAFVNGLVQCYTNTNASLTSKLTHSTVPPTSMSTSSIVSKSTKSLMSPSSKFSTSSLSQTSFQVIKPKDMKNSYSLCQATNEVSSNSVQSSFVNAHSEHIMSGCSSSNPQSATNSVLLPSTPRTPNTKCPQTETIDATTPPSFSKGVLMEYSPVIKKGKSALNSAMTDVSDKLPRIDNNMNGNNCPLSSLLIDSVATAKSAASSKKTTTSGTKEKIKGDLFNKRCSESGDLASNSVSLSEGMDAIVPLRERLGIENPFGRKTKQLQSSANQNVGKSDKGLRNLAEAGASTSKSALANQDEGLQSADKRTEKQQIHKSATPRQQMISRPTKQCKEPSPFTPMPPYDAMDTPQLKKEVSKIGVRPMNKKRMNMLLKEVYRETHQYETDSDYEPTPVKRKCLDSSLEEVTSSTSVCQSLREGAPSDSHVVGGEGSCSGPHVPSVSKSAPSASSLSDVTSDAKEGDDPLNSSQESSNSDVEDLAEESILQGWPDEEEMNPTQMTQNSSETITQRLLVFLRTNLDLYEKILMYEPLELDVLKKRLTEGGIRIGMAKLMDFLDEQCITFSMKNMSNRNNQPQRGRTRTAKVS